ncbi:geranylgeranyl reductase family protein [Paracidobacterium acidisoli]|uniref:geranylgeranyl reductase family protein n=1 Tax=Paracidobacterium acidisoli TaxID=2303751 RepID=UPI001313E979|nr:geranylgeranyl reductase family protein [Paracidobacterium acidisoli]
MRDGDAVCWDAIVVGAGPAGCAAAYDLSIAGRSVLLLDKADFPRPKACAGGLTRKSLSALRYSVTPVVRERPSAITVEKNAAESAVIRSLMPICAMTVRDELDDFCLRQTVEAGVQFERIDPIETIDEMNREVHLRTRARYFRAQFLVGADGVHSQVRRLTGEARWFRRGFALEANVRTPDAASAAMVFDLGTVSGGYGWVFPKGDHLNIGLYTIDSSEKLNRERLATYIATRCGAVNTEQFVGQYLGFGAEQAETSSARIFLVGDAGGFADPLTGEGIYGAIMSGQAAAKAIEGDLRGKKAAASAFMQATARLRADLRLSSAGARWFYAHPDTGYRVLTAPMLRSLVLRAYASGSGVAALAQAVKNIVEILPL